MEMPTDDSLRAKYGKSLVYAPMCDPYYRPMTIEEMRNTWLRHQVRIVRQLEASKRKNEEFQARMREANEEYDARKNPQDK